MKYSRVQTANVVKNVRRHVRDGRCTEARHSFDMLVRHGHKIKHSTVRQLWKTVGACRWRPQR